MHGSFLFRSERVPKRCVGCGVLIGGRGAYGGGWDMLGQCLHGFCAWKCVNMYSQVHIMLLFLVCCSLLDVFASAYIVVVVSLAVSKVLGVQLF